MTKEFPVSDVLPDPGYHPGYIRQPGVEPAPIPLFQQRASVTLARCAEIYTKRGDKYGDTWANCSWTKMQAVLFTTRGIKLSLPECRAVALAAYADMKYWRNLGGYNEDHLLDGINYDAALADEMREIYRDAGLPYREVEIETPETKTRKVQVRVNGEWKDL